jgi:hypothetical protein
LPDHYELITCKQLAASGRIFFAGRLTRRPVLRKRYTGQNNANCPGTGCQSGLARKFCGYISTTLGV